LSYNIRVYSYNFGNFYGMGHQMMIFQGCNRLFSTCLCDVTVMRPVHLLLCTYSHLGHQFIAS